MQGTDGPASPVTDPAPSNVQDDPQDSPL
jgi:hypothetical protein